MHLSTLLLATLGTSALAAPSTSAKRACTTVFPAGVTTISLSKPSPSTPSTSQILSFTTPAGAGGPCSLIATFPPGFPIASAGDAQVNVYDVNGPTAGSLVGTITFRSGETRTINSFACRRDMKYRLELATAGQGRVQFAEGNGAGVALTYGC